MRKVCVILVLVTLVLGVVNAARRRVVRRSTTATLVTMTPTSFVDRQFAFAAKPEELESLWDNYDIQRLDARSELWKSANRTSGNSRDEAILGRQYPGLPTNPGDTNELPSPITPRPLPPTRPPQKPSPPGCLGQRGQYPSPKNCANYLNCWDDVVIEQTCPDGLLFNDDSLVCDFPRNVNCGDRPPATPKPPFPPGSKVCPQPNGRYRSSTNCSEFYVCHLGSPTKFNCPSGLVYNNALDICDYQYNIDCKGLATPKPYPSQPTKATTQPPTRPPRPPTNPSKPPTNPSQPSTKPPQPPTVRPQPPSQPPSYPPQPPSYPPQPPSYPAQPPTYPPQPPSYPTQPPVYPSRPPTYPPHIPTHPPQQPSYQPQPYPTRPPSYPGNPWLSKEQDPWHQRTPAASQLEIDNERFKQEALLDGQPFGNQPQDAIETSSLANPWSLVQAILPELSKNPCNNGDVHRLNEACTSVVICKNNRPQLVKCSRGFSYDKPSDSCQPFSVAKC